MSALVRRSRLATLIRTSFSDHLLCRLRLCGFYQHHPGSFLLQHQHSTGVLRLSCALLPIAGLRRRWTRLSLAHRAGFHDLAWRAQQRGPALFDALTSEHDHEWLENHAYQVLHGCREYRLRVVLVPRPDLHVRTEFFSSILPCSVPSVPLVVMRLVWPLCIVGRSNSLFDSGLSYFSWICWIAPDNLAVNQVFGMVTGLGLFPLTFDWSQVAYNTNPLLSPHWAALNVFGGFVIFFWIVTPVGSRLARFRCVRISTDASDQALYYTNTWFTAYLPLCTADVYDRYGQVYNTSAVISNNEFDAEKYADYSAPYLPATFAFVYGISFAAITR